jgi:hypothetical protein
MLLDPSPYIDRQYVSTGMRRKRRRMSLVMPITPKETSGMKSTLELREN